MSSSCTCLSNVVIGNSVTSIAAFAFYCCTGLTNVTIPNCVTNISVEAFSFCYGLTSVTIPNNVTSIGDCAFSFCYGLTNIMIGNGVTSIWDTAFSDCYRLEAIFFRGNAPSIASSIMFSRVNSATIYYVTGTTGWGPTYGGRPTALWTPPVQPAIARPAIQLNQFAFTVTGASNQVILVEACTSLINPSWSPLQTNTLTAGSLRFIDPQWTNGPARFYRLKSGQ